MVHIPENWQTLPPEEIEALADSIPEDSNVTLLIRKCQLYCHLKIVQKTFQTIDLIVIKYGHIPSVFAKIYKFKLYILLTNSRFNDAHDFMDNAKNGNEDIHALIKGGKVAILIKSIFSTRHTPHNTPTVMHAQKIAHELWDLFSEHDELPIEPFFLQEESEIDMHRVINNEFKNNGKQSLSKVAKSIALLIRVHRIITK